MKRFFPFITLLFLVFYQDVLAQGWVELGIGGNALKANNAIVSICADTGTVLYAAGDFTDSLSDTSGNQYVAEWNGISWSQVGLGVNALHPNGEINTICTDALHDLYAAGGFTNTNGNYYVAKWDGATWSELGGGSNALNANGAINSICTDGSGNIYAAGMFTDSLSNTSGHYYVAKWNGTSWSELGTGTNSLNANGYIMAVIAAGDGNIYAAGNFRGGTSFIAYYVAKWNGTTWSELGTGSNALNANGAIWALDASGGNIYAGGFFENADSKYYVAKWDGTIWSELGTGSNALNANYNICSICTDFAGNVYAAGYFTLGGKAYVAKWNGTSWDQVGTSTSGLNANAQIYTINIDVIGNIYAGGAFTDSATDDKGHEYVAIYNASNTGVASIKSINDQINVYPNPSYYEIYVNISDELMGSDYVIYDVLGKIIKSGKLENKITELDISNFTTGLYTINLCNSKNTSTYIIKK